MNGGLTECSTCDRDPCICKALRKIKEEKRITDGRVVIETAFDIFAKVGRIRMILIKLLWPDIKKLSNDLYDYWDKS